MWQQQQQMHRCPQQRWAAHGGRSASRLGGHKQAADALSHIAALQRPTPPASLVSIAFNNSELQGRSTMIVWKGICLADVHAVGRLHAAGNSGGPLCSAPPCRQRPCVQATLCRLRR